MIPNVEKSVTVQSNIDEGATGQFTVDENALGHIMDVLTNLYSDPELAVVREYLTNAYDAHVEAGMKPGVNWTPITITTPSHFNKSYVIRDYGVGMSVDDLKETYSKYGKSTKTTSNDVVGMLGLGSKCGLTYTNSFTITGIKNGVKAKAIISKNEENIPVFHVVDTRRTDEANGVEISIPVKDRNSFAEKTREFLKFWGDGLVLVDGREPVKHGLAHVQTSDITYTVEGKEVKGKAEVYLAESAQTGYYATAPTSYVVMGNVPYAVDAEHVALRLRDNNLGFVAFVPMGAVNFPPNREQLYYSASVKNVIKQISVGLFEHVLEKKLKEVTAAADFVEAYQRYHAMPHSFKQTTQYTNLKYKGHEFPNRVRFDNMVLDWDWQGHGNIAERSYLDFNYPMTNGVLIVTGVDKKPTSYFKKKVRQYISDKNYSYDSAVLLDKDIDSPWLKHLPRVDADTIKAIKLPKSGNVSQKTEATYEFYTWDGTAVDYNNEKDIPTKGRRLAYISPADMRETYRKSGTTANTLIQYFPQDVTLVVLASNRFEKFKRTYPKALPAGTLFQDHINVLVASTSNNEMIVQKLEYQERANLEKMNEAEINDPDLVDLIKIIKGTSGTPDNYKMAEKMVSVGYRANFRCTLPERKAVANLVSKRYPLLNTGSTQRHIKHLTYYINAVYEAEYKV